MQNKMMSTSDTSRMVVVASSNQRHRCEDNPGFRSRFGIPCEEHANVHCEAMQVLGWTQDEVNGLLRNCPSSCKVPECNGTSLTVNDRSPQPPTAATPLLADTTASAELDLLHHDSTTNDRSPQLPTAAPTLLADTMASTELDLLHHDSITNEEQITIDLSRMLRSKQKDATSKACFPHWPASCQDDPTYMSRMKVGCSAFQVFNNCFEAKTIVAFSDDEVTDLISSCPCTCKMPCTEAPTPAPFTLPPVGPLFNEVAAASAAKRGSEGDSTHTLMTIIVSVGGAVLFFVLSLAFAFLMTRARSKHNRDDSFHADEDGSDTSDLSDDFRDQDLDDELSLSGGRPERKRQKKNRKKRKIEDKTCMMCPDIDLCI
jgi:hypothetical protein